MTSAGHDVGSAPRPDPDRDQPRLALDRQYPPKVKGTSPAAGTGYRIKLYVNDPTCSGPAAAESNVATFQGMAPRSARSRSAPARSAPP